MKAEYIEYMESIGLTEVAIQRVKDLCTELANFRPYEMIDFFVNDAVDKEGVRRYNSFTIFSHDYIYEFSGFLTNKKFDYIKTQFMFHRVEITYPDYDFIEANDSSKLRVEVNFSEDTSLVLTAYRNNCDRLAEIAKKWFTSPDHCRGL